MKTLILLMIISILAFYSCNNDQVTELGNKTSIDIIEYSNQFAQAHNDCAKFIMTSINQVSSDYSILSKYGNEYIKETETSFKSTTSEFESINRTIFDSISTTSIITMLSDLEKTYINDALFNLGENLYDLKLKAVSDDKLTEQQKLSVCCFISTVEKSYELWTNDETLMFLNNQENKNKSLLAVDEVVIAVDGYWAWWGTVFSGGNLAIGAACAAIASIGAASTN